MVRDDIYIWGLFFVTVIYSVRYTFHLMISSAFGLKTPLPPFDSTLSQELFYLALFTGQFIVLYYLFKFSKSSKKVKRICFYLVIIFFLFELMAINRNFAINDFLSKKSTEYVCFNYDNQNVETTEEFRLIGITADYIFLRNRQTKTNYIYRLTDVTNFQFKKIKSKKK